jgi:hypothetical protein
MGDGVPPGNEELVKKGGIRLGASELQSIDDLNAWLAQRWNQSDRSKITENENVAKQQSLF